MQNYHKILTEKEINDFVENRFESIKKSNKVKELVEFQATNNTTKTTSIEISSHNFNRYSSNFGDNHHTMEHCTNSNN